MYLKSKKQRARIAATTYTITNKRIITQSIIPKQNIQSVTYADQKYCTVLQTPVHHLLGIYSICFSSIPIKANWYSSMNQIGIGANDVVDMLSQEQAEKLMDVFKNKEQEPVSDIKPAADALNSSLLMNENAYTERVRGERMIIKHSPRYLWVLWPRYFFKYGFLYALFFVALFIGTMFESGFFSLFKSLNDVIKFAVVYVIFFLVIAYYRSAYQINKYEYVFNNSELTMPREPILLKSTITIPYSDISNLSVLYYRFNMYQVNFTANVRRTYGDDVQVTQVQLNIPGLSREDSEKILLLVR